MYQRMWISLCTYIPYMSHISNSNSPRILKMRSHDIFIVPRKREANPRRIPPSQALIKIKEQQDYPPSTRNLRFPCLFPLCTKRTIIHARWHMLRIDDDLYCGSNNLRTNWSGKNIPQTTSITYRANRLVKYRPLLMSTLLFRFD